MIGLDIAFPKYWKDSVPCQEALRFILGQLPRGYTCFAGSCELIQGEDAVPLRDSIPAEELANIFSVDFLLPCGVFFFYPPGVGGGSLDNWQDYLSGTCQTVLLVHDVGFFELYAKHEAYLQKCLSFLREAFPDAEVEVLEETGRFRECFAI